jgi:hypothetical protein
MIINTFVRAQLGTLHHGEQTRVFLHPGHDKHNNEGRKNPIITMTSLLPTPPLRSRATVHQDKRDKTHIAVCWHMLSSSHHNRNRRDQDAGVEIRVEPLALRSSRRSVFFFVPDVPSRSFPRRGQTGPTGHVAGSILPQTFCPMSREYCLLSPA